MLAPRGQEWVCCCYCCPHLSMGAPGVWQVVPCMEAGLVADWDGLEALWDHALRYGTRSRAPPLKKAS